MYIPVEIIKPVPSPGDVGYFGAVRKHDIHTGIDLYTKNDAEVSSLYDGEIVAIEKFTGEWAGSPWWENTSSILIENDDGVILYGELVPRKEMFVGKKIIAGEHIGDVKQVLKKDKGKTPQSMLHLELYTKGTRSSVVWQLNEPCPENLCNPIAVLNKLQFCKYVKVFPDWCATGIWDCDGWSTDLEDLPVSDKIKNKIVELQKKYDMSDSESVEYYNENKESRQWSKVRTMIRKELPEWTVE